MWLIWMEIIMFSDRISKLKERVVIVEHSEFKLLISPARCAGEAAHLETLRHLQLGSLSVRKMRTGHPSNETLEILHASLRRN